MKAPPNAALVVLAAALVNPIVLVLLGVTWPLAVGSMLAAVALLQLTFARFSSRLPTVYLVNALAVLGIWIHAEAIVRYRFSEWVMDDLYHIRRGYYVNRPGLRKVLRDKEFTVDYVTNKDGYRIGATFDPERSVERVDWLFIGDSYTQGAQVEFEQLYTSLLYRAFPSKVILNAGISGWGLQESLAFLQAEGQKLRPRVVFLQISNFNDFMKVQRRRASVTDWLMQESSLVRLMLQDIKYTNPTNLPLGRWVEPFYATDEENRRFNVFYVPSSPEKERDIESFGRTLAEIVKETRKLGAELILIQVPTKEQVSFTYLEEAVTQLKIDPRSLDMARPDTIVRRLAAALGIRLVNLLPAFRASAFPFYRYDEHLNESGHAQTAQVLAAELTRWFGGDSEQILSSGSQPDRYPSFNAAGDSILYQSFRDGNHEIFIADVGFTSETRLTIDDVDEAHPVRMHGTNQLFFTVGDQAAQMTRVWTADAHARNPTPLDPDSSRCSAIPAASPDGHQVAYAEWPCGQPNVASQVVVVNRRTGARVTPRLIGKNAWRPAFSPDGRRLAYIASVDGQLDVFECTLATGDCRQLTHTPFDEWDPMYAPDGERLAYSARANGNWDLFLLDLTTLTSRPLTSTIGDEWDAAFSPNGSTLVFGGEYGLVRGIYSLRLAHY